MIDAKAGWKTGEAVLIGATDMSEQGCAEMMPGLMPYSAPLSLCPFAMH